MNAPTANTVAAAEHGIALICALSRNVAQADASVKAGKWERTKYVGVSIVGKTLAVMGFGKVRLLHFPGCHKNMLHCRQFAGTASMQASPLRGVPGKSGFGRSLLCPEEDPCMVWSLASGRTALGGGISWHTA